MLKCPKSTPCIHLPHVHYSSVTTDRRYRCSLHISPYPHLKDNESPTHRPSMIHNRSLGANPTVSNRRIRVDPITNLIIITASGMKNERMKMQKRKKKEKIR